MRIFIRIKKIKMFGDLLNKIDLGDILEKVGLSDDQKKDVKDQAADALKYRANKEVARGNKGTIENLLSSDKNNEDADKVAKKLERDLEYNLKNKSKMEPGIIDQIKSAVMDKFLGGVSKEANAGGKNDGKGLLGMLEDNDLVSGFKDKLGSFFK